jgi:hypothetical protein
MPDETDGPDATAPDESPEAAVVPDATAAADVVDEHSDRAIDRIVRSAGGGMMGNAMIGLAKGMGLHKPVEETVQIREADEPEPDPDDPIQVHIDPDRPENTRIVYRVPRADDSA